MPTSFLDDLQTHFATRDLYQVLQIERNCTERQLKSAYRRTALEHHPDRKTDDTERADATIKFQLLSRCHSILNDAGKRAQYDESGSIDDEDVQDVSDWSNYWRLLFPKITIEQLDKLEEDYKYTDEERQDVVDSYRKYEGDMDKIVDAVPFSRLDDEARFRKMLQKLIDDEELDAFDAFTCETAAKRSRRKRARESEAKEAEEELKKLEEREGSGLATMIGTRMQNRAAGMEGFFANLEEKYGKTSGGRKKKK